MTAESTHVERAVLAVLGDLIGPHTSKRALAVALVRGEDAAGDELERVCFGLSPMLRTLLGGKACELALQRIRVRAREAR